MEKTILTPALLCQVTGGTYFGDERTKNTPITGYVLDNRQAKPGDAFFCIEGEHSDGHKYAPGALKAGGVCAVAQKPLDCEPYILVPSVQAALQAIAGWYRSTLSMPIVAVVGSVGKTTAKEMIAAVLSEKFCVYKTPKNLNSQLGVPLTLLAIQPEHEVAVVEIGISEFGQMTTLGSIVRPDITVFTAVAPCHLEFLGDLDGVLRAKSEIFPCMPRNGYAVLSGDDSRLCALDPGMESCRFGTAENCDYRAENISPKGFDAVSFTVRAPHGEIAGLVHAYGEHLPVAAAAAAAVGIRLGMTNDEISRGYSRYIPVDGRAIVKKTDSITIIDDCYNASPAAVRASIVSLCNQPGRHIAILGDMKELGAASPALHAEVGEYAARHGVPVLCCGPESKPIQVGALRAGGSAIWFESKEALIAALPQHIQKGDLVLVKASHSMAFDAIVEALEKQEC